MLVTDMRPLSMVEDDGFTKMIHTLNPGYTLPARTHFTKLMERKYEETFKKVKTAINTNNSKLALTTDVPGSETRPNLNQGLLKSTQSSAYESAPLRAFQLTAVQQLQERWKRETAFSDKASNTVILATVLDPRFRKLKFLSPDEVQHVQNKLQTMALQERRNMDVQQHGSCSVTSTDTTATQSTPLLDSLLGSDGEEEDRAGKAKDVHTQ
ncbi:hypothetical protein ABG768_015320, partial [Culter alburnus]